MFELVAEQGWCKAEREGTGMWRYVTSILKCQAMGCTVQVVAVWRDVGVTP